MSGLRPPPKQDSPSRAVARIVVLLVLLLVVGVTIWAAVTNQRLELTETLSYDDVELAGPALIDGSTLNVVHNGLGSQPVILLHDADVAGGVLWDGVVEALGSGVTAVRIDLPGFGLSSRMPEEGPGHTVASMAGIVAEIIDTRFHGEPVIVAGVGLGGEVAAEIAVIRPDLVSGLAMIDVDFFSSEGWLVRGEKLPFYGTAIAFAWETGGPFVEQTWSPMCDQAGWCPTRSQAEARDLAESIRGTTDSLIAFRKTAASSLVPSRLGEVAAPAIFIWSQDGLVPESSVDRVRERMPEIEVVELSVWKAHLDDPSSVASGILSLAP